MNYSLFRLVPIFKYSKQIIPYSVFSVIISQHILSSFESCGTGGKGLKPPEMSGIFYSWCYFLSFLYISEALRDFSLPYSFAPTMRRYGVLAWFSCGRKARACWNVFQDSFLTRVFVWCRRRRAFGPFSLPFFLGFYLVFVFLGVKPLLFPGFYPFVSVQPLGVTLIGFSSLFLYCFAWLDNQCGNK